MGIGTILKCNVKRQSLGAQWSMSEVLLPPPHNSNKPTTLMDKINNKNWRRKPIMEKTCAKFKNIFCVGVALCSTMELGKCDDVVYV